MNPYDVLQVSPKADAEVIRAAYRSLMQRYHPDRNPGDTKAAELSARITQAYEMLSDPARRAAYDQEASQSRAHSAPQPERHRSRAPVRTTQAPAAALPTTKIFAGLGLMVFVAIVWAVFQFLPARSSALAPSKHLADIRSQMGQSKTAEAQRRALFAQKQALLQQHSDLLLADSSERADDLAKRSMPLLLAPITITLAPQPSANAPTLRITIPEITLVMGSFDAPMLKEHVQRHRTRIVDELTDSLAAEPSAFGFSADTDAPLKIAIRKAVMKSLAIPADEAYPSTYFESPGRHGVVDVVLPQGRLRLGP